MHRNESNGNTHRRNNGQRPPTPGISDEAVEAMVPESVQKLAKSLKDGLLIHIKLEDSVNEEVGLRKPLMCVFTETESLNAMHKMALMGCANGCLQAMTRKLAIESKFGEDAFMGFVDSFADHFQHHGPLRRVKTKEYPRDSG